MGKKDKEQEVPKVAGDTLSIEEFEKLSETAQRSTGRKEAVVETLRKEGVAMATKAIAEAVGSNPAGINTVCRNLEEEGVVSRRFKGNAGYWVLTELL